MRFEHNYNEISILDPYQILLVKNSSYKVARLNLQNCSLDFQLFV